MDNYPWLKSFLQMTGGILKASSYERITSLINSNELNNLLFNFFKSIKKKSTIKLKNFDGRFNNEMDLTGIIATWDALNTQTKNAKAVINAGEDYIVTIKGNHDNFYNDLKLYFDQKKCEEIKAGNIYPITLKNFYLNFSAI